jgi:hypothetical protein
MPQDDRYATTTGVRHAAQEKPALGQILLVTTRPDEPVHCTTCVPKLPTHHGTMGLTNVLCHTGTPDRGLPS